MDAGHREQRIYLHRYSALQRVNHWIVAILFVLLTLSGLALFYPGLFWLAGFFGGGEAVRALHPWFGVLLTIFFALLAVQFIRHNIPNRDDVRWTLNLHRVMQNSHDNLPDLGKYNAGQKSVYWSQALLIPLLFVTGLSVWQRYFGHIVPIQIQRVALLVHALGAALAITVIIVHIYAGIWVKGTARAMTRGSVTGGWAYIHHRRWLKDSLAAGTARLQSTLHGEE
ncbi:MAG: formate dehydrogenase subunit gamma [Acetobacteraceae bacterium]|nr:formate dehydrogenase subunit gamma [Acetobacteraceae bacterium]